MSRISFHNTLAARPSSLGGRAQPRPALGGTFLTEPPLHLAAGTIELEEDTEVRCTCDFGCDACLPEETKPR